MNKGKEKISSSSGATTSEKINDTSTKSTCTEVGSETINEKPKAFRIQGKNLWLTYPRCTLAPAYALELLTQKFLPKGVTYGRAVSALHQDGTPHLHIILCLDGTIDKRSARFADLNAYHGNYRVFHDAKDFHNIMKYCDDQKIEEHVCGAVQDTGFKGSPSTKAISNLITTDLHNGVESRALIRDVRYQPYLLKNLQKVIYYESFLRKTTENTLLPFPRIKSSLTEQNASILRWLGMNLFQESRPLRTPQLYLHSEPGKGKTTLITTLEKCIRTYKPSIGEKYWDGYTMNHDLIVFEEADGMQPLGIMNQVLDGQTCILPARYSAISKNRNVPVIICSNEPPERYYKKMPPVRVAAFVSRLKVIYCNDFIDIFEINYS